MNIKPIETVYRGYRFRSRLEARWAVFFDALGVKWEYEPAGYHLSDGSRYLPDFWLPGFHLPSGTYVEVKPQGGDVSKARQFARDSGVPVLLAVGAPSASVAMEVLFSDVNHATDDGILTVDVCFMSKYLPGGRNEGEYRFFTSASLPGDLECDDQVHEAVLAARQARFEHGQVGAPHEWQR